LKLLTVTSRQLVAAWVTGLTLILLGWWGVSSWEGNQRASIGVGFHTAVGGLQTLADDHFGTNSIPDSSKRALASTTKDLFQETNARLGRFQQQALVIEFVRKLAVILAIAALLLMTWGWAGDRSKRLGPSPD